MSTPAQLVAPVLVARGTLSITTSEIYFEVDEEDPAFRRADPRVGWLALCLSVYRVASLFMSNYTHGCA